MPGGCCDGGLSPMGQRLVLNMVRRVLEGMILLNLASVSVFRFGIVPETPHVVLDHSISRFSAGASFIEDACYKLSSTCSCPDETASAQP
ncbi:uncharacterized protein J7T54_006597 [Emericellopsis cladophorae]|uniref:Uncharacterized protein n=1 Tax=Emericellopsis cladophorae TaxID=2686198 RepID=A0A9Q0BGJ0_9HYPO|nr:uncharacterized protein J7T54_006597 [Emericellopsis cladophorae]KAI6784552.1 hypothetical protein J7T54_006597 [Emericellopsis cladophorae]